MEFFGSVGDFSASLSPAANQAEALKAYVDQRWPVGRRKAVMNEWRLSDGEARSIVEGVPSKATIAKVLRRGGWDVALPIIEAVVGQRLDEHLHARRVRHAEIAQRHRALRRDVRALVGARSPVVPDGGAGAPEPRRDRRG